MTTDQVTWGRAGSTLGPAHEHWPEQPEAAHAASEVDDDQDDGDGAVLVTAIVAGGLTLAALVIAWAIWSHW